MDTRKCACASYSVLSDGMGTVDRRRRSLIALGGSAFAAPVASFAQRSTRYRVAWLSASAPDGLRDFVESVRQELRNLGFSEGIAFDFRYAEGRPERLTGMATELVALKPD